MASEEAHQRTLEVQGQAIRAMHDAEIKVNAAVDEQIKLKAEIERLGLCLIWLMNRHRYEQLPVPNQDLDILKGSGYFARIEDHEHKHVVFIEQSSTPLEEFKRELEILGKPTRLPEP